MKRLIDLLVAVLCLIIFSPLLLICYLAVKLEDGGPAIFKQERIGLGGKPFNRLGDSCATIIWMNFHNYGMW